MYFFFFFFGETAPGILDEDIQAASQSLRVSPDNNGLCGSVCSHIPHSLESYTIDSYFSYTICINGVIFDMRIVLSRRTDAMFRRKAVGNSTGCQF
jgi:hypothetical protein